MKTFVDAFDAKQPFLMEYRLRRHDGAYRWVLDHGVPFTRAHGEFAGYIGSCMDVTDRRDAEEKFRLAIEGAPTAIVMIDQNERIVLVNMQAERLFGYDRRELIGQNVEMLVPERYREEHQSTRAEFFAAPSPRNMGSAGDLLARRKDGADLPVEINLNPIHTEAGTFVLCTIADLSARRCSEAEIVQLRENLSHAGRVSTMGQLASACAHEINQPLGAILRNAEAAQLLLDSDSPDLDELCASSPTSGQTITVPATSSTACASCSSAATSRCAPGSALIARGDDGPGPHLRRCAAGEARSGTRARAARRAGRSGASAAGAPEFDAQRDGFRGISPGGAPGGVRPRAAEWWTIG